LVNSFLAKQQFAQIILEVSKNPNPIEVKCSYIDYTDNNKKIENSLTFANNRFIKFEEDK
jgi:hypothetical protein